MKPEKTLTLAIVGNPNSGKSTFFNALTGSKQVVGNWPGVTVEKKVGLMTFADGTVVEAVDLPGIYSLHAMSEDEKVAAHYALADEPDAILNLVDGVNLERNLFLTLALIDLGKPVIVAVSMLDILRKRGELPNLELLSKRLGVPVVSAALDEKGTRAALETAIKTAVEGGRQKTPPVSYPESISALAKTPADIMRLEGVLPGGEQLIARFEKTEGITPDVLIADARYALIHQLVAGVDCQGKHTTFSNHLDKIVLNRFLGIPVFFFIMYLLFWFTQVVGGVFIDFFDIAGGAVFVTATEKLLTFCHAPQLLTTFISSGLGSGLQTVATFIPPVFFIFLGLSILEDSGYMARAAYMMDRFMRWLGLPGSAFVPMLVGFGCTVPAIMATRTLPNRRDRLLTIFMTPFMSCGARLPVYALFGAAFFGARAGLMVFGIYMTGIALAILTGLLLKHTLFTGKPSPFVMELPEYHVPGVVWTLRSATQRLNAFLFRAGKVIVLMVLVLSVLNAIPTTVKGAGGESEEITLLAAGGRVMTPVFEPMGVHRDNWQASVALCVGLFAKEAVIGTLNSMYQYETAEDAAAEEEEAETSVWGELKAAFATIPENAASLWEGFRDPLGLGGISADETAVAEENDAAPTLGATLREKFHEGPHQAFAYLLFILLYAPCLAAMATVIREVGHAFGWILITYLTVLGWCVATLYYQLTLGHSALWITVPCVILAGVALFFTILGKRIKVKLVC